MKIYFLDMVKHNSSHNEIVFTVPLRIRSLMVVGFRFEAGAAVPGVVHQHQLQVKVADLQKPIDPFALRESFWRVKGEDAMLAFLNQTGIRWGTDERFLMADVMKFQEFTRKAVTMRFSQLQRLPGGSVWAADAMSSLSDVLCLPATQGRVKGDLSLVVGLQSFKQAILATVALDSIGRNRFRLCEKRNCRLPFKVDIRTRKRYCCEAHRQAEAMKRFREGKESVRRIADAERK